MKCSVPIVVVAYNRARSLQRLLDSLNVAEYKIDDVPLIISIDKGDNQDVLAIANDFVWEHGKKIVSYQPENLKLRRHILKCGDYATQYGNVIILEDDLYVSKQYYTYALQALEFTAKDPNIGGVSLYNHRFNVEAAEPFEAIDDGFDNWYFQFASSWGQAWTREQWQGFREWYDQNPDIDNRADVPKYVRNWPASSWLKYFIAYLIEKDKYFIYPRKSLTTNFGDAGTHVNFSNTNHQVSLQKGHIDYRFSTLNESGSVYDAFFENTQLKSLYDASVIVDLYGQKHISDMINGETFVLTRKSLPYKVIKSYGCCMRPHEENILCNISGDDFFLYDLSEAAKMNNGADMVRKIQYNLRFIDKGHYGFVIQMFLNKSMEGLKKRLKKLLK